MNRSGTGSASGNHESVPSLSYVEVGATASMPLPAGYRHLHRVTQIGFGQDWFHEAAHRLLTWDMHRRAGLQVTAEPSVSLDQVAVLTLRLGPLHIDSPVRVTDVFDHRAECGFAYGTLAGHPEIGEERFTVRIDPDGVVRAEIRAFSRPGRWYTRCADQWARRVQHAITTRYERALSDSQPMPCPCCGRRTLPERGTYELCPVCNWEDDPNQSRNPTSPDGANGLSLAAARKIFERDSARRDDRRSV